MEFLTIWIILAIVGAIVANNKGRSGVGWFLLCLLLTPVVILVFWRCRRSSREKRSPCAWWRNILSQRRSARNALRP